MNTKLDQSGERRELKPDQLLLEQDYKLILADLRECPDPEAFLSACERNCLEANPDFFNLLHREISEALIPHTGTLNNLLIANPDNSDLAEKNIPQIGELEALGELVLKFVQRSKVRVKAWEYMKHIIHTSDGEGQIEKYSDRQSFDRVIFPIAYMEIEKVDESKRNKGGYITITQNRINVLWQEIVENMGGNSYWSIYVQNTLKIRLLRYYFLPPLELDENKNLTENAEEIYKQAETKAEERFKDWKDKLKPFGDIKMKKKELRGYSKNIFKYGKIVELPEYTQHKDRKSRISALKNLLYDVKEGYDIIRYTTVGSIINAYASHILAENQLSYLNDYLEKLDGLSTESNPGDNEEKLSFNDLFRTDEAINFAIELAQNAGLVNIENKYIMGAKGKYSIAVFWYYLTKNKATDINTPSTAQKACKAIATFFGTTIGKNLWSANEKIESGKAQIFYKKLLELSGN